MGAGGWQVFKSCSNKTSLNGEFHLMIRFGSTPSRKSSSTPEMLFSVSVIPWILPGPFKKAQDLLSHMYMCLYMYVYVCVRVCVYMCICICVHVSVHIVYVCMCICIYVYCAYVCICVCCVCAYVYMCVCVYVCVCVCVWLCLSSKLPCDSPQATVSQVKSFRAVTHEDGVIELTKCGEGKTQGPLRACNRETGLSLRGEGTF